MKSENVVSNSMFLKSSLFVKWQNVMVVVAVRRKKVIREQWFEFVREGEDCWCEYE